MEAGPLRLGKPPSAWAAIFGRAMMAAIPAMYLSRPNLKPLQLDLATLEGGGSCPAEFFGETTDGQEVYVRYRNGWLSVQRGEETLLKASIGPGLHGEMLLEQA